MTLRQAAEAGRASSPPASPTVDDVAIRRWPRSRRSCCTARSARRSRTARPRPRRCGRWRCAAPRSTPRASPAPATATVPTPATGCSTPSSTARRVVVTTDDTWETTWRRLKTTTASSTSAIPELLDELAGLADEVPPGGDAEWPLMLSAGERRSFTANTNFRDPAWRKKDPDGALRLSPLDAERIGLADGDAAKLTTKRAHAIVTVTLDDTMQPGHIAVPNGLGLDHLEDGTRALTGLPPNELTSARTATRGPARRGTSPCRPGSSLSDRRHVAMTPTSGHNTPGHR